MGLESLEQGWAKYGRRASCRPPSDFIWPMVGPSVQPGPDLGATQDLVCAARPTAPRCGSAAYYEVLPGLSMGLSGMVV